MGKIILDPANECIYCTSVENLTLEHVIAYSFHGDIELPRGSCQKCAALTGRLEGFITRDLLSVGRAALGLRSRRKDLPKTIAMTVKYGPYGPQEVVQVPVERAIISVLVPAFPRLESDSEDIISSVAAKAVYVPSEREFNMRSSKLLAQFKAKSIGGNSGPLDVAHATMPRVLWKSFAGLLWDTDPLTLRSSGISEFVRGLDESKFVVRSGAPRVRNLYSIDRLTTNYKDARARVYTLESEDYKYIHAELDIFGILGMPLYYLRIDSASNMPIDKVY